MTTLICILLVVNLALTIKFMYSARQPHVTRCSAAVEIQDIKDCLTKWERRFPELQRIEKALKPVLKPVDARLLDEYERGMSEVIPQIIDDVRRRRAIKPG